MAMRDESCVSRNLTPEPFARRAILIFLIALGVAAPAHAAETDAAPQMIQIAGLEVAAWLPESGTPGPWPIIIFSHGFHGCAEQSTFLTAALAKAGYGLRAEPSGRSVQEFARLAQPARRSVRCAQAMERFDVRRSRAGHRKTSRRAQPG